MRNRIGLLTKSVAFLAILTAGAAPLQARISAEQAARLGGAEFTPVGAERPGNAAGTIPAWDGGILEYPSGFTKDGPYPDPFAADQPLFTVTAGNIEQYRDNLTDGQLALFERYPDSYFLKVYPTRRSASFTDEVIDATRRGAQSMDFCPESEVGSAWSRCITGVVEGGGYPFPFPENGLEVLWNGMLGYEGKYRNTIEARNYIVTPGGTFSKNVVNEFTVYPYWLNAQEREKYSTTEFFTKKGGASLCIAQTILAPPRNAGQLLGSCNYVEDVRLDAYIYLPGQRRVRKAPEIGFYDQPGTGSDGLHTADSRDVYFLSGSEEWFDHHLVGKQEIFIPYNSYQLNNVANPDDIIKPGVIDHDLVRYELHRVWVIESNLKPGFRHLTPKIITYVDEDSWKGATGHRYDQQGRLWRIAENYLINYYDARATDDLGTAYYDIQNGRYSTWQGWSTHPDFFTPPDVDRFTPQGLRRLGVR
ncbi:MAG: DUF1329 domain-containing protein [Pseudomonadota bacterium]|nr:DUF1329 domain-containing protein [Pseudomonadota bacterium]